MCRSSKKCRINEGLNRDDLASSVWPQWASDPVVLEGSFGANVDFGGMSSFNDAKGREPVEVDLHGRVRGTASRVEYRRCLE